MIWVEASQINIAHFGYEDEKKWRMKQEKQKREEEILKNGGSIPEIKLVQRKNQDKKLTVHLVPHSHDDMGWVKSMDQYFYGSDQDKDHSAVKHTLDTVIHELAKNETRKFTYVEMGFFSMWYNQQNSDVKNLVKELIQKKQLEIVNGGWSAHDEATP